VYITLHPSQEDKPLPLFAFIRVYKVNAACGRESALGYSLFALDLALFFLIQSKPLSEPRIDANGRELNQNPEPKKAIFRGLCQAPISGLSNKRFRSWFVSLSRSRGLSPVPSPLRTSRAGFPASIQKGQVF